MKIAAVVVNWNSGGLLRRCLESLVAVVPEIIVVDNASQDSSLELEGGLQAAVRLIRNPENRGLAAALNQGFAKTRAHHVLVLNPDAQASPGAIESLHRFLESHPKAGAVGGYVNEKYLPKPLATPWTLVRENLGMPVPSTSLSQTETEQPAAAALMIRHDAYNSIGGFDEQFYPAWYEDVDFCKRLRNAGWQIHFLSESRFLHDGGYSAAALGPATFAAAYYHNQLRYVQKHYGMVSGMAVRASLVAGMLGRIVARPARAGAYFRVIAGAFGGW